MIHSTSVTVGILMDSSLGYLLVKTLFNTENLTNDLSGFHHHFRFLSLIAGDSIRSCKVQQEQIVLFDVVLKAING